MRRAARAAASPAYLVLYALLAAGLVLRVNNNGYGLPYVYNVDEGSHFTARAIAMLGGDWDPGYYQNPSAFTYLANFALRLRFGHGNPFGEFGAVIEAYKLDPTLIYETTRTLAAVLCMVGVVAIFWAGRRLWGVGAGMAAAAILTFAFLPVSYSRIAVTDVGTLAPVALALVAAVRIAERGGRRWWLLAGVGAGLAIGFKYTAGLVLLPVAVAASARLVAGRRAALGEVAAGSLLVAAGCVGAFFVTNPYFLFELEDARRQLSAQAETAGDFGKVGQNATGAPYYLGTLTWGLGWVAALAALAGAVLELRRDLARGLILVAFPVALLIYLSLQARFFSRWMLPAYPALVLLASAALAQAAAWAGRWAARRRAATPLRSLRAGVAGSWLALAVVTAVAVAQPLAADVRSMQVLGRTDTRETVRQWLVDNYDDALRVVIEPAVPARYYRRQGRGGLRGRKAFVRGFAKHQAETRVQYPALLEPGYVDSYRKAGFCLVVTMSLIRGRAENDELPKALAYYERLERESDLLLHVSPYEEGAKPIRFDFDFSYNYYDAEFARPGPEIKVYRLRDCRQRYGPLKDGEPHPGGVS